jgi:hypothetical protein
MSRPIGPWLEVMIDFQHEIFVMDQEKGYSREDWWKQIYGRYLSIHFSLQVSGC